MRRESDYSEAPANPCSEVVQWQGLQTLDPAIGAAMQRAASSLCQILMMNIEAQPLGKEYRFDGKESDIVEVLDTLSGLRIIVSTWTDSINEALLEVYFSRVQGYRYLDEGDLIAYWQTEKLRTSHHVYEITSGGWLTGETLEAGILEVAKGLEMREWFICTTNGCMNVLAASAPVLTDRKW